MLMFAASVGGGNATQPFSAACWFFGRDIFKFLNYPIGKHLAS